MNFKILSYVDPLEDLDEHVKNCGIDSISKKEFTHEIDQCRAEINVLR